MRVWRRWDGHALACAASSQGSQVLQRRVCEAQLGRKIAGALDSSSLGRFDILGIERGRLTA
jgi:hypothetical protein